MSGKNRTLRWIAAGTFAAALFASASPAQARDGWGRHGFRSHARVSVYARPYFPRVRYVPYSYYYRPYYAVGYYEPYPYAYYGVRRAYWPRRVVFHHRHRY